MRSVTRGLLEVDVIVHFFDKPLFSSDLVLSFVYEIVILMSNHTHNRHTRGGGELE